MNVLDVDAGGCSIILQDDLLQKHESPLVLCVLAYLHHMAAWYHPLGVAQ